MSSKRRVRRASCAGKVRHTTPEAADLARSRLLRDDHPLDVYECRWCGGWHCGHRALPPVKRHTA